ncbi:T9SS type A sorting domain-containing protein [Flavobacterium sp. U410]
MMKKILFFVGFAMISFSSIAQIPTVSIQESVPICNPGDCVDLTATYSDVKETSSYSVQSIPFNTPFALTGGTVMDNTSDDKWSPTFNLPFNFCFYGQVYNKLLVGSNGVITFDIAGEVLGGTQSPSGMCPFSFSTSIPNSSFPIKNAIYGVYQDTDIRSVLLTNPDVQNVNYYIEGNAPNRIVVVNFNQLPQFQCNNSVGLQTSQIVLYETSNVIEVYVQRREACTSWQGGVGVIGIQNQAGSLATVPPGRNTGNWSATNEAWRFSPDGISSGQISWYANEVLISGSEGQNTITVCPNDSTTYKAEVSYPQCDNSEVVIFDSVVKSPESFVLNNEPKDLVLCTTASAPYTFDLTKESEYMLDGVESFYYDIVYFTSYDDAFNYTDPILSPEAYLSNGAEEIYVRVDDLFITSCTQIRSFNLIAQESFSGTINYPVAYICNDIPGTYLPQNTALAGGTYQAIPAGLAIDSITGEILPSASAVGTYNVYYHLDATDTCSAYDTPYFVFSVLESTETPTILSNPATCTTDGTSFISNYNPALVYIINPIGPFVNASGQILNMMNDVSYTVIASNGDCDSATSIPFMKEEMLANSVDPTIAPTTNWTEQIFAGNTVSLSDLQIEGNSIKWYDLAVEGSELANSTLLIDNVSYFASQTTCDIESTNRLEILVNRISDDIQVLAPGSTVGDLIASPSSGRIARWYLTETDEIPLTDTETLVDGIYYVEEYSASVRSSANVQEYISNRVPVEVQVSALSISGFESKPLLIYPNPSRGIFTINSDMELLKISIYDILGKEIQSRIINRGETTIDLTKFQSGIYLLKAFSESKEPFVYKVIKQ